ncbi:lysozyme inhibitor LprI family protein [uncultured Deinococcus sp.]|uniref:lysozyme inhibitor LprI family protein n=1 Tax=uncultured Deinococcus sp. TaxID=158789 RepID=UPI00258D6D0A|nr:lysozyme inhibitor LprI family protein [uncultured Deinococcus sp.]
MSRMLWSAALLPVLALGTPAQAQQSCNAPQGTFDRVYCDAKVLVRADDELNVSYQKLLGRLNAAGQQLLRQSQRAWLAQRNRDCVEVDPQRGSVVFSDCAVEATTSRLNFLNDRLRECASSGCQNSRLR